MCHVCASQYTARQLAEFKKRLAHLTLSFSMVGLTIEAPDNLRTEQHASVLRQCLSVLSDARWRLENKKTTSTVLLGWALTPALVSELRALPKAACFTELHFYDCYWLEVSVCRELPAVVPTQYSEWVIGRMDLYTPHGRRRLTPEHIMALCRGAVARGRECERLWLRLLSGTSEFEEQEDVIRAVVQSEGLGTWLRDIDFAY